MLPLNRKLRIKLIILSLVFPVTFSFIGFMEGIYFYNNSVTLLLAIVGLIVGVILTYICYRRKLFTIALYQAPIPLSIFLLVWWVSNLFVSEYQSILIAIGGLLLGLWLNKELVLPYQFYKMKKRVLAIVYIFFSIALLGYFIGIPAFNILLGILAGNYLSIRVIRNYKEEQEINKNFKQGSAYTSFVLLIITAIATLLAISDIDYSLQLANRVIHSSFDKTTLIILMVIGGVAIITIQYFVTLFTAKTMFQLWKHKRFSRYMT